MLRSRLCEIPAKCAAGDSESGRANRAGFQSGSQMRHPHRRSLWAGDPLGPAVQTNLVRGQRYLQLSAAWPLAHGAARMVPVAFVHSPSAPKAPKGPTKANSPSTAKSSVRCPSTPMLSSKWPACARSLPCNAISSSAGTADTTSGDGASKSTSAMRRHSWALARHRCAPLHPNRHLSAMTVAAYSLLWVAALRMHTRGDLPPGVRPPKWRQKKDPRSASFALHRRSAAHPALRNVGPRLEAGEFLPLRAPVAPRREVPETLPKPARGFSGRCLTRGECALTMITPKKSGQTPVGASSSLPWEQDAPATSFARIPPAFHPHRLTVLLFGSTQRHGETRRRHKRHPLEL